jgi:hypothetical protein
MVSMGTGSALSEFDLAAEEFRKAYLELDSFTAETRLVRYSIRVQAGELAADVLGFCPLFREAYVEAVAASARQTEAVNASYARFDFKEWSKKMEQLSEFKDAPPSDFAEFLRNMPSPAMPSVAFFSLTDIPFGKLRAATKAFFFFIRAYQDALYRMALQVIDASESGRYSAMTKAFFIDEKAGSGTFNLNPVAKHLKGAFPEYCDWFISFRNKRNLIKNGIGSGYSGPDDNLGVVLAMPDGKGGAVVDCSLGITISDWALALRVSAKLANIILVEARKRSVGNSPQALA